MAVKLTKLQAAVLGFMREYFAENDQLPPVHVISSHFGYKSLTSAHDHIKALEAKGCIEKNAVGKYRFARAHSGEAQQ